MEGNYSQPPPLQQQQQTVVVMNQPGLYPPSGQPQNIMEWSTGLCGCFEDCCSCMYAFFCHQCYMCTLASEMNENACGPFCCQQLFVVPMRTKLRTMYGIRGSVCKDIFTVTCCGFCATTQMHRQLKNMGRTTY